MAVTHRIGVISDTHGLLREEVKDILKNCEIILHGGDINSHKIINELEQIAPVYVVKGNNDKEWAEYLGIPETLHLELYGLKIFMIHDKKYLPADLQGSNLIIYGHSHKYAEKMEDERTWLNPGSCGPRRFGQAITMAVIEVTDGQPDFTVERIDIPHQP